MNTEALMALKGMGVDVSVDGVRIQLEVVASTMAGLAQSEARAAGMGAIRQFAEGPDGGGPPAWSERLAKSAISVAVLRFLVYREARRRGDVVPRAEAEAFARKGEEALRSTNAQRSGTDGVVLTPEFLVSDQNIRGIQIGMTIRRELAKIGRAGLGGTPRENIVRWLRGILQHTRIKIAGIDLPRESIPEALPQNLL